MKEVIDMSIIMFLVNCSLINVYFTNYSSNVILIECRQHFNEQLSVMKVLHYLDVITFHIMGVV